MIPEPIKYIVARIRQALAEDERTNLLDLSVNIVGGKVFLIGQVDSSDRRRAAEEVAREVVPAEMTVVNELWLANYSAPLESETLP
jgi:osmotically-inducible protein OsmY